MLDETGVYSHAFLLLGWNLRHTSPKAGRKSGNLLTSVTEVHFERRVAHYIGKLAEALPVVALVVGRNKRVALHSMVKR